MANVVVAGRFELIGEIAAGAMGSIWLARHLALGTPVVVKLIKSDLARRPDAKARFEREARIAAQMRSAHVVQVLDYGLTEEGDPYLVMEHLEGQALSARLLGARVLSLAETAAILVPVCRAMTKAHEAGLVHRDLKPDNIFLAREGSLEVVKVLDFGVVKVPDALAGDGVDPTVTGALVGTPCYMSPEQAQGLRDVDFRADLWSLGVIAFECLTGVRVFSRGSLVQLIRQITIEPVPVPSQRAPALGILPAVDAWMARALSRDPLGRFASALALAESFAHIAATGEAPATWGGSPSLAAAVPLAEAATALDRRGDATRLDGAAAPATTVRKGR